MKSIVRLAILLVVLTSSQLGVAKVIEKDTATLKSINESTLKIPSTWHIDETKGYMEVQSQEKDIIIRLLDLPTSKSAGDTIALAWKRVNPQFSLKVHSESSPPPNDGWDELYQMSYEVPASESRHVGANAKVLKKHTYVILFEGTHAGLDRRGAQMGQIFSSWKDNHLTKEDLSTKTPVIWSENEVSQFDSFIHTTMDSLQVPGASIAIVQNSQITYKKGFGVKKVGSSDSVTTDTLFMIGSITKPLTTLLMAKAIEEKHLKWNTPVVNIFKTFMLADSEMTQKLDIEHTVCACTGMPRRDFELVLNPDKFTPETAIESLRSLKPTTGFGETFQYSNQLVALGGYATARAIQKEGSLEKAFSEAMKTQVFGPLEMRRSTLNADEAHSLGSASPHSFDINNKTQTIEENFDNAVYSFAPAGAVWSTAEDLAKVGLLELSGGLLPNGKRFIAEKSLYARRESKIKISDESFYGLGLVISSEHGLNLVGHDGGTAGFSSTFFVIPEKKLALVILTNTHGSAAGAFIAAAKARFLELTLGANPKAEKKVAFELHQRGEELKRRKESISLEKSKLVWIKKFTGRYSNSDLGRAKLVESETGFEMEMGHRKSMLGVRIDKNGDKNIVMLSPPWAGITFIVQNNGDLLLDGGQFKYIFKREG